MISGHVFIDLIVGTIAIIGGIILLFHRLGLISFGRKDNMDKIRDCKLEKCPSHDEFEKKLTGLHEAHIVSHNLHKQHEGKFANSKDEFDAIKASLKKIGENIAVLKDRSDREERLRSG